MNRIIVDEGLTIATLNENILTLDINENNNYFINNLSRKYVINVNDCNVNIFTILEESFDLDIMLNINNAKVTYNLISYNAKDQNMIVNLNSESSEVEIYNSLVTIGKQKANINILHNAPNTKSNVYNCAATTNVGSVIFNVTSKVFKGMKSSKVNQDSKIISLNGSNENEINPILLIDEYDTEAKHAAFIGKFKDEEVFYMQTRGIKKKDAYNLLLKGFLIGTLKVSAEEKENLIKKYDNWR